MIKNIEPLCLAEVKEYLGDEDTELELMKFIKKFSKIEYKDALELKKEIEQLNLMKIKPEQIAKIIDLLPETGEELNKIFTDVSLDEDETNKILDSIKKFK